MNSDMPALWTYWNWTPILMFHQVVEDGTYPVPPYAVTRHRFREILTDFKARGYTSGTLDDVLSSITGVRKQAVPMKPKKVVLTFDDGTRDFIENALPVLQELNYSATLFVVTGMVGGRRTWYDAQGQHQLTPVPIMNAREMRSLQDWGCTIGSHTVSHQPLANLHPQEAQREIAVSRQMLGELLGEPVRWFAYPYLSANDATRELVKKAGYDGACGGPNRKHSRYYMSRIDASYYTIPQLRLRTNGLFQLTRHIVRRVRTGAAPGSYSY